MNNLEKIVFEKLKKEVSQTFLENNSALSPDISKWKGDDIIKFQEDLLIKVKGRVSEKWFYNYFRNDIQKLPRIDMLNLLSEYVGSTDWASFVAKHQENKLKETQQSNILKHLKTILSIVVIAALIGTAWFAFANTKSAKTVQFCFVDENQHKITDAIHITVQFKDETERTKLLRNGDCLSFQTEKEWVKLLVKSPYYKEKEIERILTTKDYSEEILLPTDIYSLILRRFSNTAAKDWKLRRNKLTKLIADDAIIYQQWFGKDKGIEMYSKADFVYQMTVPTSMLKHLEILEIAYKNDKIQKLRFRVNKK